MENLFAWYWWPFAVLNHRAFQHVHTPEDVYLIADKLDPISIHAVSFISIVLWGGGIYQWNLVSLVRIVNWQIIINIPESQIENKHFFYCNSLFVPHRSKGYEKRLHFRPFFRPKTSAQKTFQTPPVYLQDFFVKLVLVLTIAEPESAQMAIVLSLILLTWH